MTSIFHVGGGIVADSVPAAEDEESLTKARNRMAAVGVNVDDDARDTQTEKMSGEVA